MPSAEIPVPIPVPAKPPASPATGFALALLSELVRLGVQDVVIAPGSRSQALALVAAEFERADLVRLHVRVDERGAAFLALGLALESGRPAVIVTTSGTAVANLHPALLEAHHTGVPLLAITADRPSELRGIGENQTTVQPGMFAQCVRLQLDVSVPEGVGEGMREATRVARQLVSLAMARGEDGDLIPHPGPGPVHLNVQFRAPLSSPLVGPVALPALAAGEAQSAPLWSLGHSVTTQHTDPQRGAIVAPGPLTVVVAGTGAGPAAEAFARIGGWPLLAEVTSGARFGPNLIAAYRHLLREPDYADAVERAVVFGHPTLSREVPALVGRRSVETIVVAPSGIEWFNPGRRVRRFERRVRVNPRDLSDRDRAWLGSWVYASRAVIEHGTGVDALPTRPSGVDGTGHVSDPAAQRAYVENELQRMRQPITRRVLVNAVWEATWPHDRLVFGASRLIREADSWVIGKRVAAYANRGLAGIDGTVATATGVALAHQTPSPGGLDRPRAAAASSEAAGVTRVLLGDLSLLHDIGSLLIGDTERRPRLQVIVGNDRGGSMFDRLEVAESTDAALFDRVQFTPQDVDFAAIAAGYGWLHARVATRGDLVTALSSAHAAPVVIEVPLAR